MRIDEPERGADRVMRSSGRALDALRSVVLEPGVAKYPEGSCLAKFGDTHVLCTASVEECVPPFLRNTGKGWVTAEYGIGVLGSYAIPRTASSSPSVFLMPLCKLLSTRPIAETLGQRDKLLLPAASHHHPTSWGWGHGKSRGTTPCGATHS
jgi:hypothetical protein